MKHKKLIRICAVVLVLAIVGTVWWFTPRKVFPDNLEVASIRVFSGNTGELWELDAATPEGAELLQLLRASTLTNRSFDQLGDGFCYILELHNANGRRLRSYTFNGQDYFHTGLFGYRLNEPEKGTLETVLNTWQASTIENTIP
ncbi:MAG: hypothetical protein HPZ79_08335 [Oscillospiraceae bacterium]|nr:hypothetical protein [Oscillospiraceae bacterium]